MMVSSYLKVTPYLDTLSINISCMIFIQKYCTILNKDPQEIGKIECYLDWHHTNTKLVSKFVMTYVLGPVMFGKPAPND